MSLSARIRDQFIVGIGIGDAHDASACLVQGNRLLAAIAEERPQRVKGMGGFPEEACLRQVGIERSEVDCVVFGSQSHTPFNLHNAHASLLIADHLRMQEEYWLPVLDRGENRRLAEVFPWFHIHGCLLTGRSRS